MYFKIEVREGDIIPWGYWVAWRCWDRDTAICMPIPINFIVGWFRATWVAAKRRLTVRSKWEEQLRAARWVGRNEREAVTETEWQRGFEQGRAIGWNDGWQAAFKRMDEEVKSYFQKSRLEE